MIETRADERPRKAIGPDRLTYLDGSDVDRVMAVVLALVSEVASLRERLDTHERLADQGIAAQSSEVEAYRADAEVESARDRWRDGYIRRLFRVITEDMEALREGGPEAADPAP